MQDALDDKQDTLVSGTNIKTINGSPILGSGDIEVASDIDMFADTKNGTFYRANKKGIYWYTGATAFNLGIGASDISFSGDKILMFMQKIDADDVQNLQDNDTIGYALGLKKLDSNDGEVEILSNYYIIKYDSSTSSKTKLLNGNGAYIDGLTSITHISNNYYNKSYIDTGLSSKQDTLVSGTNIKTINNESILGSGNINIQGGSGSTDVKINGTSITSGDTANIAVEGTYNASTNKLMTKSEVDGYDASWITSRRPSVADFNAFYNYIKNGGIRVYTTSQDADQIGTGLVGSVEIGGWGDEKYIGIFSAGGLLYLDCDGTKVTKKSVQLFEESRNKVTSLSSSSRDDEYPSAKCVYDNLATKQPVLVSGTNIKTINNTSILGNGNISLPQVTDSYSVSTTDSYSCNYVNGLNGKILWVNPNPTKNFGAQTISVNFSNCDMYELVYYQSITRTNRELSSGRIRVGKGSIATYGSGPIRAWDGSNTSLTFENASDNQYLIPAYIIGYKTRVFD